MRNRFQFYNDMAKDRKTILREIAESKDTLTDKQRDYVRRQSEAMGVQFRETSCGDCYRDQAAVLWRILCEKDTPKSRKYLLRAGVDVIWKGRRVNATCSDDDLAALLEQGFPRNFMKRIDGKDGNYLCE